MFLYWLVSNKLSTWLQDFALLENRKPELNCTAVESTTVDLSKVSLTNFCYYYIVETSTALIMPFCSTEVSGSNKYLVRKILAVFAYSENIHDFMK